MEHSLATRIAHRRLSSSFCRDARGFSLCVPLQRQRHLRRARSSRLPAVNKDEVLQDVRIVIADQLGIELESIPPETKFADIGADSLDTVEIMMALEEKFELTLDEEGAEQVRTVQDAAELIARQIDSM